MSKFKIIDERLLNELDTIYTKKILEIYDKTLDMVYHKRTFQSLLEKSQETPISKISSTLLLLAELRPFVKDNEKHDEIIHENMIIAKEYIEYYNGEIEISLFDGLTDIALSIYAINSESGYYKKFLHTITMEIANRANRMALELIENHSNVKMSNFDVISGLSGVLNYLLNFKEDKYICAVVENIIRYLISLTKIKNNHEEHIPNYFINNENQFNDFDRSKFPNGCINYGISHGISGPLIVLSRAFLYGIKVEGQEDAIKKIYLDITSKCIIRENKVIYPSRISLEDYIINSKNIEESRASWCYGSIGIMPALQLASKALRINECDYIFNKTILYLQNNPEDWGLISPTICHGLSGLIIFFKTQEIDNYKLSFNLDNLIETLLHKYDKNSIYGFNDVTFDKKEIISEKYSFLTGTVGVILTLKYILLSDSEQVFLKKLLLK